MSKTIKQNLKDGIDTKNWGLVIAAYEGLTGEKMSVEPEHIFTMKDKPRRSQRVIEPNESEDDNPDKVICKTEDFSKSPRFNMFVDDGKEASNDKLSKAEKLDQLGKMTHRSKQQFRLIKVTCSRCHQTSDGHPDTAKGFICDKCSRVIGDN